MRDLLTHGRQGPRRRARSRDHWSALDASLDGWPYICRRYSPKARAPLGELPVDVLGDRHRGAALVTERALGISAKPGPAHCEAFANCVSERRRLVGREFELGDLSRSWLSGATLKTLIRVTTSWSC